jgi:hypothetical protein
MAHPNDFHATISALNQNSNEPKLTMAELIAKVWAGKFVEIYIGDTYEDLKFEDSTTKIPSILVGKIINAYAECIVLNCAYKEQTTGKILFGNVVCLNERGIRTITEIDGKGGLKDTFIDVKDGKKIVEAIRAYESGK